MPAELVSTFIRHLEAKDLDSALALLSDDCEYDNVPMSKVHGPAQVGAVLGPFLGGFQEVDWVIHHQVASGTLDDGVVMNERTDRFRAGERWIELPVAGLFLVKDGKITLWRDYFDMASLSKLMAG